MTNINELEEALDDKKAALVQLEEKLNLMKQSLREAQAIADKYGLTFTASLDLPEGAERRGYDRPSTVAGTYHGAGTDTEYDYELKDEVPNKTGFWYWKSSSLNC